jgi:hypothetical protein
MKLLVIEMPLNVSFQGLKKELRDSGIDFLSEVLLISFRVG